MRRLVLPAMLSLPQMLHEGQIVSPARRRLFDSALKRKEMAGSTHEAKLLSDWSAPPPWPIFKLAVGLSSFLKWLERTLTPPTAHTMKTVMGFLDGSVVATLSRVGVPDALADGPLSAEELANKLGLSQGRLERMLRLVISQGFFKVVKGSSPPLYRNSAASATLRSAHPNCLSHMVQLVGSDSYTAYEPKLLEWCLRQPSSIMAAPFDQAHGGKSFFEWAREHPEFEQNYSQAMSEADCIGLKACLADYAWSKFKRVLDIGGANGSVLAGLLKQDLNLMGVLFDQNQVVKRAAAFWKEEPDRIQLLPRVSFVGGNFFKPEMLPPARDGDVFILRNILHNWLDEDALRILQSVKKAIGSSAAVVAIMEQSPIDGERETLRARLSLDIMMMGQHGAKERTKQDWLDLAADAGFRVSAITPTRSPLYVIELMPI